MTKQKTPRALRLRANINRPRSHLIFSQTGDTLPGNGGDRRRISAPRLQGAFSPGPGRACTIRPLSLPGSRGYSSLSQPFAYRLHSITFSPACQEHGRFFGKLGPFGPFFPVFRRKSGCFSTKFSKLCKTRAAVGTAALHFTAFPGRKPRSRGDWAQCRWNRW